MPRSLALIGGGVGSGGGPEPAPPAPFASVPPLVPPPLELPPPELDPPELLLLDPPPLVLLRELLLNLVDNAVKYTPAGGRITVRCGLEPVKEGTAVRAWMEVEDDGPGIAPEEHERVLQRFYRVPGTAGEGNGLGLAIASELAKALGGRLVLGPRADGAQGLEARVELPEALPA